MASPTVTNLTSFTDAQRASNGQQLQPSDAYRITGGTADDRLTMDEIVRIARSPRCSPMMPIRAL